MAVRIKEQKNVQFRDYLQKQFKLQLFVKIWDIRKCFVDHAS